jgi:hypothetical protein
VALLSSSEIFRLPGRLNFRRCSSRQSPCYASAESLRRHSVASRFAAQRHDKSRARARQKAGSCREWRERHSRKVVRWISSGFACESAPAPTGFGRGNKLRSDDDRIDPLERAFEVSRDDSLSLGIPVYRIESSIRDSRIRMIRDLREHRNSRYIALHAPPARSVSDPRATIKGNS